MRQTTVSLTAGAIIALLELQPDPEGGHLLSTSSPKGRDVTPWAGCSRSWGTGSAG
jgi:hypothetical protein